MSSRPSISGSSGASSGAARDEQLGQAQRGGAFENVVDVVRSIVDLHQIVLAIFVVKYGDAHLSPRRGENVFVLVSALFFKGLVDVR